MILCKYPRSFSPFSYTRDSSWKRRSSLFSTGVRHSFFRSWLPRQFFLSRRNSTSRLFPDTVQMTFPPFFPPAAQRTILPNSAAGTAAWDTLGVLLGPVQGLVPPSLFLPPGRRSLPLFSSPLQAPFFLLRRLQKGAMLTPVLLLRN